MNAPVRLPPVPTFDEAQLRELWSFGPGRGAGLREEDKRVRLRDEIVSLKTHVEDLDVERARASARLCWPRVVVKTSPETDK